MATAYSPEDEIVAYYLKMMIDNENAWPSHFLRSEDVYCVNPWTLFDTQNPITLHDGRYFFVNRTEDSGKTDRCESGCWRVMGRDKLIKSEDNETTKVEILGFKKVLLIKSKDDEKKKVEILGFKKVFKFCETEKPRSFIKWVEIEKRKARDKRVWVMEEYRLASKRKQDYVICKIRLLNPNPLEFMLSNHVRGYYI